MPYDSAANDRFGTRMMVLNLY